MQATDTGAKPSPASTPSSSLTTRLRRLSVYFGNQRMAWSLAVVATLVGAITEPLIPALLQPLLDKGFTQGTLPLWAVPLAILGVFFVRGIAQFVGQYALARIANEGMLALRKALFERVLAAEAMVDLMASPRRLWLKPANRWAWPACAPCRRTMRWANTFSSTT